MQNEEGLVRRAQDRDAEAFEKLYEANFDRVYRYVAVRIGDQFEAEDITQEVFIKALHGISSFRWKGVPFLAWLYRIAHNMVVDHYRKGKMVKVPLDAASVVEDDDPQEMCETNSDVERVMSAASKLTEAQHEVITLRFVADLSVAEVAAVMGRTEGAVKALQHSALVALRKLLVSEL